VSMGIVGMIATDRGNRST